VESCVDEYLLKVGHEGAARLDLVDDIFGPCSRRFLLDAGLRAGVSALEVGCGTGNMTRFLAETVGSGGRVVAVDASPRQIEIARERCAEAGERNVTFLYSTAENLDLPPQGFDVACCRLLLMHLRTPDHVVGRLLRFLVPGGILACEEPTSSSLLTVPRIDAFHRVNDGFLRLGAAAGLDLDIGDRLYSIFIRCGLAPAVARYVQPILPIGVAKALVLGGLQEGLGAARRAGIVSEEAALALVRELEELVVDPSAFYAVPRLAQIAGTTP